MGNRSVPEMFDVELAAVVEVAGGMSPEQWQMPSLCTEWTVRDVFHHLAFHTHRAGVGQLVGSLLGGSRRLEARLSAEAHADMRDGLLEWLASRPADSARDSIVNLCELVIHQQDVRRPAGVSRQYPEETLRACLDHCITFAGNVFVIGSFKRRGRGLQLVATDIDWLNGDGPIVEGTAEALLMAIAGRPAAIADLTGPGVDVLASRFEEPAYATTG